MDGLGTILSSGTGAITPLSGRSTVSAAAYSRTRDAYDFAIGGIPLLSKIDDDHPYVRGLAPIRKDQFDNQQIPGEQSLTGWWLRSQNTFIGGQGINFQDPIQSRWGNEYGIRYGSGYGVNPWTDGKLTLLKRTTQFQNEGSGDVLVRGFTDATFDPTNLGSYWHARTTSLRAIRTGSNVVVTWGGAGNIVSLTSSGNKYYVASDAAGEGVYRGVGSGAGTKLWNNDITYTRATLGYSMQRLMGAFDNKVYELGADPGAPPVNLSTLTPIYTHPNTAFVWTSFATGTSAIYATGHDGQRGYVYKFALTSTGAAPTLSGGAVLAASMPLGETLLSAEVYLGKFMGMGTSRGFRIAEIDDNGDLAYGPLLFEISGGVKAMAGFDRFFWVGATASVNGKSGLYRVDLGQVLVQQAQGGGNPTIRYAYATDLSTPPADNKTGTVTGVTPLGTTGRMVLGVNSGGSYVEHATEYEATGVMTTGKVRFNTLENKLYKFMSIRTPDPLQGGLSVSSLDKAGNAVSLISYTTTVAPGGNDVAITAPEGPQEFISLQFTLTRNGGDATKGPELNGWQIKAVPGVIRQRMITMSFLMFDFEVDKAGQKLGYAGRTKDRLRSIEMSAQTGEALQFQDLQANTSDLVFVEDMEFKQMASPGKGTHAGSYGGVLTVQMRTVNDNVNL